MSEKSEREAKELAKKRASAKRRFLSPLLTRFFALFLFRSVFPTILEPGTGYTTHINAPIQVTLALCHLTPVDSAWKKVQRVSLICPFLRSKGELLSHYWFSFSFWRVFSNFLSKLDPFKSAICILTIYRSENTTWETQEMRRKRCVLNWYLQILIFLLAFKWVLFDGGLSTEILFKWIWHTLNRGICLAFVPRSQFYAKLPSINE